ncbi:DNA and RNA helicase [Paenibacillus sp. NPDC058071]|uniref:DNA and RNA helicase n=1 Tax=Paenibacillus sp. NPDC058071 TaxID=3346326 RepID=UPI0036D97A3B
MFTDRYPSFTKGRILKTEMLDSLRDYPRHMLDIHYASHSDGVITGADVTVRGDVLTISRGIVKYGGRLYSMEQEAELPYTSTGKETLIKVRFPEEPVLRSDMTAYTAELVLDEETAVHKGELELGRFKLKQGARLRADYESFRDLMTEYNTLQFVHVRYSAFGESTLSPVIMRAFGDELLRSGSTDPYDLAFAMLCLNEGTAALPVIEHYISARLGYSQGPGRKPKENEQLYVSLRRILDNAAAGKGRSSEAGDFRPRSMQRVLVD